MSSRWPVVALNLRCYHFEFLSWTGDRHLGFSHLAEMGCFYLPLGLRAVRALSCGAIASCHALAARGVDPGVGNVDNSCATEFAAPSELLDESLIGETFVEDVSSLCDCSQRRALRRSIHCVPKAPGRSGFLVARNHQSRLSYQHSLRRSECEPSRHINPAPGASRDRRAHVHRFRARTGHRTV